MSHISMLRALILIQLLFGSTFAAPTRKSLTNSKLPTYQAQTGNGTVGSQYQIVTICNTRPSILKCQDKRHFLIIHRALFGVSDGTQTGAGKCTPRPTCLQEYYPREPEQLFECTGSKFCVFYPSTNRLALARCQNLTSNLTQLHLTCASLDDFNKYIQSTANIKDRHSIKTISSLHFNANHRNLNTTDTPSTIEKSSGQMQVTVASTLAPKSASGQTTEEGTTLVIVVTITVFYSFLAILLVTLTYFRFKIQNALSRTGLGICRPKIKPKSQPAPKPIHMKTDSTSEQPKPTKAAKQNYLKRSINKKVERMTSRAARARESLVRVLYILFAEDTADGESVGARKELEIIHNLSGSVGTFNRSQSSLSANLQFNDESSGEFVDRSFRNLHEISDCVSLSSHGSARASVEYRQETGDDYEEEDDEAEYTEDNISIVQDLYNYYNTYRTYNSSVCNNFVLYDIPEEDCSWNTEAASEDSDDNFVEILKI